MKLLRPLPTPLPKEYRPPLTPGRSGKLWRGLGSVLLAVGIGSLVASIIWEPSKRNIEVLAGLIFLGFVLVAAPFSALLFMLVVIPYPAYTSVGTTNMLLIFAVAGLALMKSKQLRLASPFFRRDLDMAILGWVLMILISWYVQPMSVFSVARYYTLGFITAVILYYLTIYLINDRRALWGAVKVAQLAATTQGLLGLFQELFPDKAILPEFFQFSVKVASMEEIRRGQVRVQGTFSGEELYAEYMALSIIVQYVLFRRARNPYERAFWLGSALLLLVGLFASATRGAFLALVIGIVYMVAVGGRAIPRVQLLRVLFFGLALTYLAVGLVAPITGQMFDRLSGLGAKDSSVESRSIVLREAVAAIPDSPFIGHGVAIPLGTFHGPVTMNIHCLYVTLAYTLGIPGLVFFLWFLVNLWKIGWRDMRDAGIPPDLRELSLALNTCMVMFLLDELKIEYTRQSMSMHLTWLLFAFVVATHKVAQRSRLAQ